MSPLSVEVVENTQFKDVWLVERLVTPNVGQRTAVVGFYNTLQRAVEAVRRRVTGEITAAVGRAGIDEGNGRLNLDEITVHLSPRFTIVKNTVEVDNGCGYEKTQPEGEYANGETSDRS